MKNIRIRLTTATTVALLLSGFAARVLAYPTSYGPFAPGHEPAAITLTPCKLEHEVKPPAADTDDNAGAVREYRLPAAGQSQITLALRGTTNG